MNIFVDCGASNGNVSKDWIVQGHADWEYYLFEPNPIYNDTLDALSHGNRLTMNAPKIVVNHQAVWIENTKQTLVVCNDIDASHLASESCGASVQNNVEVECIDFSTWTSAHIAPSDYAILKMDIEGAEFSVLSKLIADGTIHLYKECWVEWHEWFNLPVYSAAKSRLMAFFQQNPQITHIIWY
jgi:FkbM family methyltransferase